MSPELYNVTGSRTKQQQEVRPSHYYGDHVRRLFLAGGAIMIFSYPFFKTLINIPVWVAIGWVLIISIFAGLQTPRYRWSAMINVIVSTIAFCTFVYKSSNFYLSDLYPEQPLYFWVNQLLALIFFFGIYFSIKSTRASLKL